MKIRFKDKEIAGSVNSLQNEYKVVAKEKDRQGEYVYTFYNNCFVIEHQNEYYYLNQFWWG